MIFAIWKSTFNSENISFGKSRKYWKLRRSSAVVFWQNQTSSEPLKSLASGNVASWEFWTIWRFIAKKIVYYKKDI